MKLVFDCCKGKIVQRIFKGKMVFFLYSATKDIFVLSGKYSATLQIMLAY